MNWNTLVKKAISIAEASAEKYADAYGGGITDLDIWVNPDGGICRAVANGWIGGGGKQALRPASQSFYLKKDGVAVSGDTSDLVADFAIRVNLRAKNGWRYTPDSDTRWAYANGLAVKIDGVQVYPNIPIFPDELLEISGELARRRESDRLRRWHGLRPSERGGMLYDEFA